MDYKWIGWAGTVFLGLTIINSILGGAFISSTDVAILNQTGITTGVNLGIIQIPLPNLNYISGLFHMFKFDYSFFGGTGQLILFALYSVTFMVGFMVFITVIGLGVNAIRGR